MHSKPLLFLLTTAALLLAAACGDDDDADDSADAADECQPADDDDGEGVCGPGATADGSPAEDATVIDITPGESDTFAGVTQDGLVLGSADAGVEVTLFENFVCPSCRDFALNTFPGIVEDYVAVNGVRFVFQHTPLGGEEAVLAHMAAECAAQQNLFWNYAEAIFENQTVLSSGDEEGALRSLASDAGLDIVAFDACFESAETRATIEAATTILDDVPEESRALPLLVINGEFLPQPTDAELRTALDAALSTASE